MKNTTIPKPMQIDPKRGTLKGLKVRHTDSSGKNGNKGLSFGSGEGNAKLTKGGKAVC